MVSHIEQESFGQAEIDSDEKLGQQLPPQQPSHTSSKKVSSIRPKPRKRSLVTWFTDLPVRRKQLIGLFTSEIISVIGLTGVGSALIILGGRSQLIQQAKAETSVVEIEYNLKIDQMGFGFRGQSDNAAIIQAALLTANGQALTPEIESQVKQILQNETKARIIEYATLVDRNGNIIVNANANRQGQPFDPNGLVSRVLKNPKQIKASSIVSWGELQQESPPLPDGFSNSDALIRYTVTPVLNPANGGVIGALVSGDIVNNKLPIVQETLNAFQNGYAAVYMQQASGDYALATSSAIGDNQTFSNAQANVALPSTELLATAVAAPDGTATDRVAIGSTTYSTAAQVIRDVDNQPVAVLVRGTSEASLNALILNSLAVQLLIALVALGADAVLAVLLGRSIANPIKQLKALTQKFADGDRRIRADLQSRDEIGDLANTFNGLANTITQSEQKLRNEAQQQAIQATRAKFLAELSLQSRQLSTRDFVAACVEGAREALQTDRVLFFEFDEQWEGNVTAESVGNGWPVKLGDSIHDPCFSEKYVEQYREGRVQAIPDIEQAGLEACHLEILAPYSVR
ncbi:MAG: HAMP domain-containing protein, partial [Merismopedia sp. SIO2A8]|nr:HAMP domain-containing protein [Merismopedia sp. SIO2A8]